MPYWRLYYHLVWATKGRLPLLDAGIWPELARVLTLVAHQNKLIPHAVGGVTDHVHVAVSIPPAMSVATAVGRLKGSSSRMLNQHLGDAFAWQGEYGVVSFGERHLPQVVAYISDQPRRHANNALWPTLEHLPAPRESTADATP